ncbi:MAG TPA: TonB family protein [Gammaproteobacteria bacterium]|jgi:TonB family protein|nr:TonB family protein [Gammaproteobacteria bacterium]
MKVRIFTLSSFFWLSLFLHLLFFSFFYYLNVFITAVPLVKKEESYYRYVPAYTYAPSASSVSPMQKSQKISREKTIVAQQNNIKSDRDFDLSRAQRHPSYRDFFENAKSLSDLTHPSQPVSAEKYMEPIHMIGEKLSEDPLRNLLGRAITAKLYYSKVAKDLQMHGMVSVGFVLHPDGQITGARVIKKSRERILDAAALNAINDASPVHDVDIYLREAKYLVVNIIF